ncbi:entry exclusion protein [Neisseria sp. KEM232]|uniref:EexN family lipoprotein n=1 Tax=unclassified Neisseria TaxID=2623750 RepID=UPI000345B2C0|nr:MULTISPECIES: EexN family lipoprotein [unclassified Neisseria]ASP16634.1 entry exclusion protein [Neisseria sp. KEM232]
MNKLLLSATALLLLAACGEEAHDVQWYLDHPQELDAQLDKCSNDPAKLRDTPACINAREAAGKRFMGYGKFKPSSAK